jgi:hypothetical protein
MVVQPCAGCNVLYIFFINNTPGKLQNTYGNTAATIAIAKQNLTFSATSKS